jgi:hypothetical protein
MKLQIERKLKAQEFACGYVEVYRTSEEVPYYVKIASPPFMSTIPKVLVKLNKSGICYDVSVMYNPQEAITVRDYKSFDTLKQARDFVKTIKEKFKTIA